MPTVNLSPVFNDAQLNSAGDPGVGLKLFTYAAGSSTKTPAYTTSAGSVAHTNPIILNARGEPASPIWIPDGVSIKFVLAPATDTDPPSSPIRTIDNVMGTNDSATVLSEWTAGPTPTFVSSTSFTLAGDQTTDFHIGRRLKTTDTSGTDYTAISGVTFAASITTVKVDAAVLDAGLSAVAFGPSANNTAIPLNDTAILSPYSPLTPFETLAVATTGVATATITADKVVVANAAGRKAVLSAVSLTVNIANAGANGLDTGAEAAGTLYYFHVIWNGVTVAGLLSVSPTAPTMPAGYTHKGLVGAVRNDASSDFIGMSQRGRYVSLVPQNVLILGSETTVTQFSVLVVPPAAWACTIDGLLTALAATVVTASVWSDAAGSIRVMTLGGASTTDTAPSARGSGLALLRTSQALWYSVSNANADLTVVVTGYLW